MSARTEVVRRVALRTPRPIHGDVVTFVGTHHHREYAARYKSGAVLVHDGHHEDRSGGAEASGLRDGTERVRGLRRGRAGGVGLGLFGERLRTATGAVLPRNRLRSSGAN